MGYPESYNELEQWWDRQRLISDGDALIRVIEDTIVAESEPDRVGILNRFLAQEHLARGNQAAADAVFRRDPAAAISLWCRSLREGAPDVDIVPILQQRIRDETYPAKLHALRHELATAHRLRRDHTAAEAVMLADAAANPDEPLPLISLADHKLYAEGNPTAAMAFIGRAVEVAMRTGIFRRHALATKARIALALADHAVVEDAMRRIMQLTFTRGHPDIGVERDILDRLPPGAIDEEVAQAYDAYCRRDGEARAARQAHVDGLVMEFAKPTWRKVARIILEVLNACERDNFDVDATMVAGRIRFLVEQGRLEAQRDLSQWRFSEVRRPAPADAEREGPPAAGGSAEPESTTIVASRVLTMETDGGDVEVPVSIYQPIDKGDHWRCEYEIGWPDRRKHFTAGGIDAVQALLLAAQMVGVELYVSDAHNTGRLKWDEPGGGYGFPLSYGMRDLYQGRDKQL
jgi:protein-disulfide isomerase-like protein with CxxC motif